MAIEQRMVKQIQKVKTDLLAEKEQELKDRRKEHSHAKEKYLLKFWNSNQQALLKTSFRCWSQTARDETMTRRVKNFF